MHVKIISESGKVLEKKQLLKSLNPYEIIEIIPQKIFDNLPEWLNNEQANCSIEFKINGAFTRTLVGNRTIANTDMQVTHSNFAYNHHETDFVDTKNGVMPYPYFKVKEGQINIYPDMPYGEYSISYGKIKNNLKNFSSGKYISHKIADYQDLIYPLKGQFHLPSRIPIGLVVRFPTT